ncbi:MAG: tyrosine-type recombinase/integrase [Symbiobacteriia bacterium]
MAKRLPEVLTTDEVCSLLEKPNRRCPTGLRNYTILLLMYRAGLRVSEVLHLQPRDIDWKAGDVRVNEGKGKKDRVVPVEPWVLDALGAWQEKRPASKWFFSTLDGEQLDDRYLRAMVKRLAKKARIEKDVHPHMLRHTYATQLLGEGLSIREVQDLLGHADVSTTMIYTHVNPVELRRKIRLRTSKGVPN